MLIETKLFDEKLAYMYTYLHYKFTERWNKKLKIVDSTTYDH